MKLIDIKPDNILSCPCCSKKLSKEIFDTFSFQIKKMCQLSPLRCGKILFNFNNNSIIESISYGIIIYKNKSICLYFNFITNILIIDVMNDGKCYSLYGIKNFLVDDLINIELFLDRVLKLNAFF